MADNHSDLLKIVHKDAMTDGAPLNAFLPASYHAQYIIRITGCSIVALLCKTSAFLLAESETMSLLLAAEYVCLSDCPQAVMSQS